MLVNKLSTVLFSGIVLLATGALQADLIFTYNITDAGHILNGATITSSATGSFTWESPAGYEAVSQYAGNNDPSWSTTISGATGAAGSQWNGAYTYTPPFPPYTNTGVRYDSSGRIFMPAGIDSNGGSIAPRWTDGTNTFNFRLWSTGNPAPPADGTPVDFSGINAPTLITLGSVAGSTAPAFFAPSSGTASASTAAASTAVPEPTSMALLGFGLFACGGRAYRRRRKAMKNQDHS